MKRYGTEYDKRAREWFVTDSEATEGYVESDTKETAQALADRLNEGEALLAAAKAIIDRLADVPGLEGLPSGTLVAVPIDDIMTLSQATTIAKAGGAK